MADYELFYPKLRVNEGGYVKDPLDRGGETYAGISRRWYFDWIGWKYVDKGDFYNPELDKCVKEFYKKEFWDYLKLDKVIDQELAENICDFGIHSGTNRAVKTIQKIINIANDMDCDEYYSDIKVDGWLGSITLNFINKFTQNEWVVADYKLARIRYYVNICFNDESQSKYLEGWITRVLDL